MDIMSFMPQGWMDKLTSDVDDVYDFRFKAVSMSDFELFLVYRAKSGVLRKVFDQVKKKLPASLDGAKQAESAHIESFVVPDKFNNRVHTSVLKSIKAIDKSQLNPDGIRIYRSKVERCTFVNAGEKTEIKIKVVGQYVRHDSK